MASTAAGACGAMIHERLPDREVRAALGDEVPARLARRGGSSGQAAAAIAALRAGRSGAPNTTRFRVAT